MAASYNKKFFINMAGLFIIGIVSLFYIAFGSNFAEISILFQSLPFPVFVGEILTFTCLAIFLFNHLRAVIKINFFSILIFLYFIFVVIKALLGFNHYGVLALRHTALFYYPIFVLFGYFFYNKELFNDLTSAILCIALLYVFILNTFDYQWMFSCFFLCLILIISIKKLVIKLFLFIFLVIATPYYKFFHAPSMSILSNGISLFFLIMSFLIVANFKAKHKIFLFLTCFIVGSVCFVKFSNRIELSSLFNIKAMYNFFVCRDAVVQKYKDNFIERNFGPIKLYNPENKKDHYLKDNTFLSTKEYQKSPELTKTDKQIDVDLQKRNYEYSLLRQRINADIKIANIKVAEDVEGIIAGTTNAIFRIFIWRDALEDLIKYKPIFGFDFGKPFRSISLEIYNWGISEWSRDGWVSMHNSYLDLIYRAGIIGITLIIFIARLFIKMVAICYSHKTYKGLVLCSIILNWLIAAFFLSKFELPYTAIPFWTMFGMTYAYLKSIENNPRKSTNNGYFLNEIFNNFL